MIYSIRKILFLIMGFSLSFFLVLTVNAVDESNITSQNFVVNLANMDPLGGTSGRSSPVGGIGAFTTLLEKVANILLFMIPIIAVISLLIAGYFYIFSAGDSEKASKAKTIIKWNIVAMIIAFLSYAIVKVIAGFFTT